MAAHSAVVTTIGSWRNMAPFGRPVVPDVN